MHFSYGTHAEPFKHFSSIAHLRHKNFYSNVAKNHQINLSHLKTYNDFITAAAVAAAEVVIEENEKRLKFKSDFFDEDIDEDEEEEDDVFNGEESIKDTLQFLGMEIRKKKK